MPDPLRPGVFWLVAALPLAGIARGQTDLAGTYLVVLEEAAADYRPAALRLAKGRGGELATWDGDWERLAALLLSRRPAWLALVLDPATIDANLPRRLLPVLARFDDDPCIDCAFGLITGATGADALRLVERGLEARELPARKAEVVSAVLDRCLRVPERSERGPEGRELATTSSWLTGKDPGWRDSLATWRGAQAGAGLVEWGHCGDPQGIWLFSMYRNRERGKHWPFDPAKVGRDPDGELPRLAAAALLEGVDLGGAVVVNGACHSAVTGRAVVGPDIVSTFGDTGGVVRFFAIRPEESFPLQAIAHGAGAYLGALAANNANRAAIEEWWLRTGGVALGEVLRRTYDELVLGAATLPVRFGLFRDGEPGPAEPPMFHSSFHRVLFGDPALVPWREPVRSSHRVEVEKHGDVLGVKIRWDAPSRDPFVWDPWQEARPEEEQGRIYERIELDGMPAGAPRVTVRRAYTRSGKETTAVDLAPAACVDRDPWGKAVLHLVLRGPRARLTPLDRERMPEQIAADVEVRFGN